MFTPALSKPSQFDELSDAWVLAAHESRVAWQTWLASAARDRGAAYVGYRASLDREEHAATVLAAAVATSRNRGGVRSSLV
jgi:hypothetical protein